MANGKTRGKLHLILRLLLAILGIGILLWLAKELATGTIHWSVADYITSETIESYVAASTAAKVIASSLFAILSLGLIAYAINPKILFRPIVVVIWLAVMIVLGLMLKPFSARIGP